MSFWSQSSDRQHPRRNQRENERGFRDSSPDTDMFFDTSPNFGFVRSNLADRLGSSVFEDFPTTRRTSAMRSFPSHPESNSSTGFGSLHRHRPGWSSTPEEKPGTPETASPKSEGRGPTVTLRHPFFQRSESTPVRHGSRSSTPDSTGSTHSHSSAQSKTNSNEDGTSSSTVPEGVEEHPGVSAKTARPGFTARRQPKVHHIPIHVEPRDGSQPIVLSPPIDAKVSTEATETTVSSPSSAPQQHPVFAMPPPTNIQQPKPSAHEPLVQTQEPTGADDPVENAARSTSPPTGHSGKATPANRVEEVRQDVEQLQDQVAAFSGARGDKQYLFLDEMLTRCLIKLDNIDTEGNEELRKARRAVVIAINGCIQALEQKVVDKDKPEEKSTLTKVEEQSVQAPDQHVEAVLEIIENKEMVVSEDTHNGEVATEVPNEQAFGDTAQATESKNQLQNATEIQDDSKDQTENPPEPEMIATEPHPHTPDAQVLEEPVPTSLSTVA